MLSVRQLSPPIPTHCGSLYRVILFLEGWAEPRQGQGHTLGSGRLSAGHRLLVIAPKRALLVCIGGDLVTEPKMPPAVIP